MKQIVRIGVFALSCGAIQPAVAVSQYCVRYSETVPALDGVAETAAWGQAEWSAPFEPNKGEGPSKTAPTRFKAIYTSEAIYFYVECMEPHPENIFDEFQPHEFWLCDVVEIYATAFKEDSVHLILSAHGNRNEEISGVTAKRTRNHIDWQGKSRIGTDRWTCEFRLPLVLLGAAPVEGPAKVMFNMSRNTTTTNPKEYSCWQCVDGGFAKEFGAGVLILEKSPASAAAKIRDAVDPLKLPEPESVRADREKVSRIKKSLFGED